MLHLLKRRRLRGLLFCEGCGLLLFFGRLLFLIVGHAP
jgi:hypothetical protein